MVDSETINKFIEVTGASAFQAIQYLEETDDFEAAVNDYYSSQLENEKGKGKSERPVNQTKASAGPKIRTFNDLNSNSNGDNNLFTGGEKSGLQVENPDKRGDPFGLVNDLLKKAEETGQQPDTRPHEEAPARQFVGTGHKLGSTDSPSEDGFQVGDGDLYRYDDPANARYLADLNAGRAPLALLDVEIGQEVDVTVHKKIEKNFTPPKKARVGFQGKGQRLGSPVPGDIKLSQSPEVQQETQEEAEEEKQKEEAEQLGTGDSPVQIRLANGQRIVHRFNSTDSVAQLYAFVNEHSPSAREFVLSLAFPVKPIENNEDTLKDAGLINAVVVQRWK
ncbi:UBX (ubiquitin regulatory X) domain-containing protein that regulates Glc7p phosphatase activity and [Komagataella phaffii GS115]|uniref:UBX (Ubiquitin regulatory X) domain-containing protein that regulates Glc7p phosphatase activity and n=1 Tax=Komagataella phaffii (strain GS115 / ATCC 20864) TaxID=644223 RepID=C4QZU1_KOMPG|nr:UBX (ubiquitin regulatory X) domain-containing protein that regulates Glc7p phosphatase activity and [Komagataella phaffii GS115]CAY68765.1 UBX (ubiquitin regulatory X) domain-containing protein that regulates Glc7p phosphatase activity and [Komagataella phaffii GS115]